MLDITTIIPEKIGDVKVEKTTSSNKALITFKFRDNQKSKVELNRMVNRNLFMFGLGLFAGEGTKKTPSDGSRIVEFINSDPTIILNFIDFLIDLGFSKKLIHGRVQLSCKSSELEENINKSTQFWSSITGISLENFRKPNIRIRENPKQKSVNGTFCILLNSRPLWRLLNFWFSERIAGSGFEPLT